MKSIIAIFSILFISVSCSTALKKNKTLQKRSNDGQLFRSTIHKKMIRDGEIQARKVEGSYFTAWMHAKTLQDGSYFHGGEVTIIDQSPTFDFE